MDKQREKTKYHFAMAFLHHAYAAFYQNEIDKMEDYISKYMQNSYGITMPRADKAIARLQGMMDSRRAKAHDGGKYYRR